MGKCPFCSIFCILVDRYLIMANVDIMAYRMAIGTYSFNRYFESQQANKYRKLSTSFELFLLCFCQLPHIFAYILVTTLNISLAVLMEIHKYEKLMVLLLFFGRYRIFVPKTSLFMLFFLFTIHTFTKLESNVYLSKLINQKSVFLGILSFALHSNTFESIFENRYSYRSQKWLFICGDVSLNPGQKTEDIKFMHWNLNSLTAHSFSRIPLLEVYMVQHNLDIAAISESALSRTIPDSKIEIPGYNSIRFDLENSVSHGGVIICHKNNMAVINRTDLPTPQYTLILEITINRKKRFLSIPIEKLAKLHPRPKVLPKNLTNC